MFYDYGAGRGATRSKIAFVIYAVTPVPATLHTIPMTGSASGATITSIRGNSFKAVIAHAYKGCSKASRADAVISCIAFASLRAASGNTNEPAAINTKEVVATMP